MPIYPKLYFAFGYLILQFFKIVISIGDLLPSHHSSDNHFIGYKRQTPCVFVVYIRHISFPMAT